MKMYFYQLGYYGYEEGIVDKPVLLGHTTKFTKDEVMRMLSDMKEEGIRSYDGEEAVVQKMIDKYGFVLLESEGIDMSYL